MKIRILIKLFIILILYSPGSIFGQIPQASTWSIIEDDFESGNLDDWGKVPSSNPSAQPQLAANQGVSSSTGLSVTVTQNQSYLYQSGLMLAHEGYLTFWFDPNNVIIPDEGYWVPGKSIRIADIKGGSNWDIMVAIRIRQIDGGYFGYLEWCDAVNGAQYDYSNGQFELINDWQKITIGFKTNTWVRAWINEYRVREINSLEHCQTAGSIVEMGKASSNSQITPSGLLLYDNVEYNVPSISDLYVNQITGNDENDGLTQSTAFATIQKAADIAGPGTVVHIAEGRYTENVRPAFGGELNNPVIYQAETATGDSVILDGTGIDLGGWGGLFYINNVSHIRMNGLHLKKSTWAGISCYESNDVEILNCSTYDTRSSGIYIRKSADVLVQGNDIRKAVNGGSQECLTVSQTHDFEVCYNKVHDGVGLAMGG